MLVLPVSQVPPFPADQEYPPAINGVPQETYLDWMRSAYLITVTGCPAISVPAGTTPTACRSGSRSSRRTARTAPARGRGGVRGGSRRCLGRASYSRRMTVELIRSTDLTDEVPYAYAAG